jgi:hypothetical protein
VETGSLSPTVERIREAFARVRVATYSEAALQQAVAQVLSTIDVPFTPEVALSRDDRIDFLAGNLGIECKVDGPTHQVTRQLRRYASHPTIHELLLITTLARHRMLVPVTIEGKTVHAIVVNAGGFA